MNKLNHPGENLETSTLETLALLGPMVQAPPDLDTIRQLLADPVIRCRCLELVGTMDALALRAEVAERYNAGRGLTGGGAPEFGRWFGNAVAFAHDPAHEVHPDGGESPATTYPAHLVFRLTLDTMPDTVVCYSVDRKADGMAIRHASFTLRLVGGWDKATLNLPIQGDTPETMMDRTQAAMAPFVMCLFGGDVEQATPTVAVLPARNVARPNEGIRVETPLVYHVTAPWPVREG